MANGATYNRDHSNRSETEQGIIAGPGAWPPVGLRPPVALIPREYTLRGCMERWLDKGESWFKVFAWYRPWGAFEGHPAPWKKDYYRQERERWPEYKAAYDAYWEERHEHAEALAEQRARRQGRPYWYTPYVSQWRPSLRRDDMLP